MKSIVDALQDEVRSLVKELEERDARIEALEALLRQARDHVPVVEANKDFPLHKDITDALA